MPKKEKTLLNMRSRGFSLLEVLIALAIIALVMVALLRLQTLTTSQTYNSNENFRALVVAINEAEDLTKKKFTGETQKEAGGFRIEARTGTVSGELPAERLKITVSSKEGPVMDLNLYHMK
ncbi:MAG: prepilin-type N-terminal cleavage/methylation domain-containing protein [Chloroflexi bacterium]|nr:prepilin-type N-terminal cleavage/methylation domain-containing protein [Chloroflexota bacterium]